MLGGLFSFPDPRPKKKRPSTNGSLRIVPFGLGDDTEQTRDFF
jgi:hypothetical protein